MLFLLADSVAWLFAARALQGLTTGTVLGAAGAALLDLHPRRDGHHASLVNGVVSVLGIGTGALVASVLVQYAPSPLTTPFVRPARADRSDAGGHPRAARAGRPQRGLAAAAQTPRVPSAIRGQFALSGLGVLASWSVGGLYLALGPAIARDLLHTDNHLAGGAAILVLCLSGAVAQLGWHGMDPRRAASVGAGILAAGMALTTARCPPARPPLFLAAGARHRRRASGSRSSARCAR